MRTQVLLLLFLASTFQASAQAMTKTELATEAQKAIRADGQLQQIESQFQIHYEHPKLIHHPDYQTLIYHEVYRENLSAGASGQTGAVGNNSSIREWDFVGGDVRFHFNVATGKVSLQKTLFPLPAGFSSTQLFPEEEIPQILLRNSVAAIEFKIRHRFWQLHGQAVPVYWLEVKTAEGPRTIIIHGRSGAVLANYSRRHHESFLPPILVRDGSHNNARNKKYSDEDDLSKIPAVLNQYKNNCQLISMKKGSVGSPLLINQDKCELVYDGSLFKPSADDSAKGAQANSFSTLSFYGEKLGQWGLDFDPTLPGAKRTPIVSIVHIGFHFDNAYWDEDLKIMVYGDGSGGSDPDSTRDYTLALDIAGHEYTHALVSQTANFATPGEPGAMNEAFADIFGILIDRSVHARATWSIGAKLYNNLDGDKDEVALRSLANPAKYKSSTITASGKTEQLPFPTKYSERFAIGQTCNEDNDQCEIHANSTIFSHAAYLLDKALQDRGMTAATADLEVARIYFTTLTHKLHENESMKSAAIQLIATCAEISQPKTCEALTAALKRVELD